MRELLQQALDALESTASIVDSYYIERGKQYTPECDAAITALKSALAAPMPEPVGQVLSEAQMGIWYDRRMGDVIWWNKPPGPAMLYAAPPAAPMPEPVAWLWLDQDGYTTIQAVKPYHDAEPLYAAPPAAPAPVVPLTDEQKQRIHDETGAGHALICLVESYIHGIGGGK